MCKKSNIHNRDHFSIDRQKMSSKTGITISYFDPLGQPKVTAGRDRCFRTCCPYVRTHFQILQNKTTENNARYWRDHGSGRVDHRWHLSCFPFRLKFQISTLAEFFHHWRIINNTLYQIGHKVNWTKYLKTKWVNIFTLICWYVFSLHISVVCNLYIR